MFTLEFHEQPLCADLEPPRCSALVIVSTLNIHDSFVLSKQKLLWNAFLFLTQHVSPEHRSPIQMLWWKQSQWMQKEELRRDKGQIYISQLCAQVYYLPSISILPLWKGGRQGNYGVVLDINYNAKAVFNIMTLQIKSQQASDTITLREVWKEVGNSKGKKSGGKCKEII